MSSKGPGPSRPVSSGGDRTALDRSAPTNGCAHESARATALTHGPRPGAKSLARAGALAVHVPKSQPRQRRNVHTAMRWPSNPSVLTCRGIGEQCPTRRFCSALDAGGYCRCAIPPPHSTQALDVSALERAREKASVPSAVTSMWRKSKSRGSDPTPRAAARYPTAKTPLTAGHALGSPLASHPEPTWVCRPASISLRPVSRAVASRNAVGLDEKPRRAASARVECLRARALKAAAQIRSCAASRRAGQREWSASRPPVRSEQVARIRGEVSHGPTERSIIPRASRLTARRRVAALYVQQSVGTSGRACTNAGCRARQAQAV